MLLKTPLKQGLSCLIGFKFEWFTFWDFHLEYCCANGTQSKIKFQDFKANTSPRAPLPFNQYLAFKDTAVSILGAIRYLLSLCFEVFYFCLKGFIWLICSKFPSFHKLIIMNSNLPDLANYLLLNDLVIPLFIGDCIARWDW